jgi:hypothetical protein
VELTALIDRPVGLAAEDVLRARPRCPRNRLARTARRPSPSGSVWARENDHQVSERGRIPKTVVEAYQTAN